MKKIVLALALLCTMHSVQAQKADSLATIPRFEIALQANQLLKQLLSFGGNTVPFSNPYLFSYNILSKNGKWGFRSGFGYTLSIGSTSSPTSTVNSNLNNFDVRIGFMNKKKLYKNFYAYTGADYIIGLAANTTRSRFSQINTAARTSTIEFKNGAGPILGCEYYINPRLKIGTEATYYMTLNINSITGGGLGNTTEVGLHFTLSPPAVLYLAFVLNQKVKK